tara:strand:- start:868 stop:1098 length:231 start_codon:yes stop_codon:yes gene_type:complete
MKTILGHEGKLSQKQITRLGGLIALVCGRIPYEHIITDLNSNNFLTENKELTPDGKLELRRLTAMAGLRPEQFTEK